MNRQTIRDTTLFLIVFVPLCLFVLDPLSRTLTQQFQLAFPAAYANLLRVFTAVVPCAFLGLVAYYGVKSIRAFREGVQERRDGRHTRSVRQLERGRRAESPPPGQQP